MAFTAEQHREYQKKRRLERLAMAVERLGGKCVRCGSTENLEFDHIIPGSRLRKVSEATNWSMERFLAEVDKCQLLCGPHHREKTRAMMEANTKLKAWQVDAIRASKLTQAELATRYNVSRTTISNIKLYKRWNVLTAD